MKREGNGAGPPGDPGEPATEQLNAEIPRLMGTAEVSEVLGTTTGNLDAVVGLPPPAQKLRCSRIWRADIIEQFAAERRERRGKE